MLETIGNESRWLGRLPGGALLRRTIAYVRKRNRFRREFRRFCALAESTDSRDPPRWEDRWAFLNDAAPGTDFDRHYVYHTAWAARILARTRPDRHVDISSFLYFAVLVSAFVPMEFGDIRPAKIDLPGLTSRRLDLMSLPYEGESLESLSCMHVVEHVGLGRYGDEIDPTADLKAIKELKRVVKPGGNLLLVVPVGRPRTQFNAHRVYEFDFIVDALSPLRLRSFALIPDQHEGFDFQEDAPASLANRQDFGTGCFHFVK